MNAAGNLARRAAESITSVIKNMTSPMVKGTEYATRQGPKNAKGLFKEMFGAEEEGITTFKIGDDRYSGAKMAGTASLLGIGYRFLSGGGVYRDKDGNTDWAGIPFV